MNSIWINNENFDAQAVDSKLTQHLPDWEQKIFTFLKEWFSTSTHITIKTSGSTGTPKEISKSKLEFIQSARATGKFFAFSSGQTALLSLPADYIAGRMMLVRAIVWDLKLMVIEPKTILNIPNQNFDFGAMTPPQVEANFRSISNFKSLIIGGAPISKSLENQLSTIPTNIYSTFGMTETVSHVALRKIGAKSFLGLERISFDQDNRGCLIIHAPLLNSELLITNDLVEVIGKSRFIWLGRYDNVINSGGIKLSAEAIESKLTELIDSNFFITAQADDQWGQVPMLVIESEKQNTTQIMERISKVLDRKECPKQILTLPQFEFTENGKLNRKATLQLL